MQVTRNSDVFFNTTFKDNNGNTLTPASVVLRVSFKKSKTPNIAQITMSAQNDGSWLGVWTAANCDEGDVSWAVIATGASNISDQGCFTVIANKAQP